MTTDHTQSENLVKFGHVVSEICPQNPTVA